MPSLTITHPAGALEEARVPALAAELTTAFLRWEGAPDTRFTRSVTWVEFQEVAFHVGGEAATGPVFRVHATVPVGAFTEDGIAGLAEEVQQRLGGRTWLIVTEVPDGRWAAGGRVVDFDAIRAATR